MLSLHVLDFLLLWTLGGAQLLDIIQPKCCIKAKLGETVTLKCLTKSIWRKRVWYRQGSNKRLQLLASTNNLFNRNAPFDNHYSVESSANETTLTIKGMTKEDVGTYFCGIHSSYDIHFGSGTVLETEGESEPIQSVLQSPDFIRAQPGDSVTLSCSFSSSRCSQEHTSVMWVRTGSASSEIVSWNYGNENIFCENNSEHSCVFNLTLKDMSSAEDGTYLCVVSTCGDTLIGNATRIHLYEVRPPVVVIALTVSNVVFGVTVVILVWLVCHYKQRKEVESCYSSGVIMDEDEVTYTGVSVVARSAPRRSTSVAPRQDTVVYSEVRNHHV